MAGETTVGRAWIPELAISPLTSLLSAHRSRLLSGIAERPGQILLSLTAMLTRIQGRLESVERFSAVLEPPSGGLWFEVLLPGFVALNLADRVGQSVTLHTLHYLESQGQGSAFVPRLIGFTSPSDRRFFELFTTVKGLGARKALKALAREPAAIAAAIAARDTKELIGLPEIGKRLAETIVAELSGKIEAFLVEPITEPKGIRAGGARSPAQREAIATIVALGAPEAEAEAMVLAAAERAGSDSNVQAIIRAVYAGG